MSDSSQLVRSLLDALRQAGASTEAATFERAFADQGWHVGPADYLAVTAAIQSAVVASPPAPPVPTVASPPAPPVPPVASAPVPARFEGLAPFSPWVDVLPGRWSLVEAVDEVLRASTTEELCRALTHAFVDVLGFEARGVDEHARLGDQGSFTRLEWLAEHDGFHVVVAELRYAGRFTQVFDPVFRLRPHAIVFAIEDGCELRVVARQGVGGRGPRYPCRTLRGRGLYSSFDDDLLTWARRLALLQPRPQDGREELRSRAERCVVSPASEVGRQWESGVVDPSQLPGSAWERSSAQTTALFLQSNARPEDRLMVGLQFELRAVLPWRSKAGVAICFVGFELLIEPESIDTCIAARRDRVAVIRLDLVHENSSDSSELRQVPFAVEAVVHVPDEHGVYCIGGVAARHVPGIVPREVDDDPEDDDEFAVDDAEPDLVEGEEPDAPDAEPAAADPATPGELDGARVLPDDDDVYRGPSEIAVLRLAVAKRLRSIGYTALQVSPETLATPELARAWLVTRYGEGRGRLCLAAIGHLRRHLGPAVDPWRRVRLDDDARLPAWACPEAAVALPPGWAVPVAGARLGPGGVLTVPVPGDDGRSRLVTPTGDAFAVNPRYREQEDDRQRMAPGWVCERWSHRAAAQAGQLGDRPDVAASAVVPLRVACVPGAEPRFRLATPRWPTRFVRRVWCVDLPVGRENQTVPLLVVVVGQWVAPGDVIATVDRGSWAPRAPSDRHVVATRAARLLPRDDDDDDAPSTPRTELGIVRSPPGLSGHVARAGSSTLSDRFGSPLGHRIIVETVTPVRPVAVRLRDGRRLSIDDCGLAEMPYSLEDGSACDAVLEDEGMAAEALPLSGDWIDGGSGELIGDPRTLDSVEFEYPELAVLPDPDLPIRTLDGLGIPRSNGDARLTHEQVRWWRATEPAAAGAVDRAASRPHGWHPAASSLYELAVASHVGAPPIVPTPWGEPRERQRALTQHDPVRGGRGYRHRRPRDGVDPVTGYDAQQRYAPWAWSCVCGALHGEVRAFERCRVCDARTEPRIRTGELPPVGAIGLGTPVVHPWRKPIVAALLGLTPDELQTILSGHDVSALADATRSALSEPERSLLNRLARDEHGKDSEGLARGFEALEPVLRGRLGFEDLWLSELCLLPTRLLPDALPAGAADLLASPLTRHYRVVASAAGLVEHAKSAGEPLLRSLTAVRLQRAVDELFGQHDAPGAGTLAELWRRIWPTTVDGQVEFAVAGLFRGCSTAELGRWRHASVFGERPSGRGDDPIRLGIVGDGDVVELPPDRPTRGVVASSAAHQERQAWCWATGPALPKLAAICLGVDVVPDVRAELQAALPDALSDTLDIGRVVLRELLRAIEPTRGRPSVLRRLLDGVRAEVLPSERDAAVAVIRDRMRAAFGARDPGTRLVEHAFAIVLTRFSRGPVTENCPTGWRAVPGAEAPALRFRRCVPRFGDAAWLAWPGFLLLTDPIRCASEGRWNDALSIGHRAWLGLDTPPPPSPWWSEEDAEALLDEQVSAAATSATFEPATDVPVPVAAAPVPVAEGDAEPSIRVLSISAVAWIAEHSPRPAHG